MPTLFIASPFLMDPSEQPVTGAAQRRKQRRLRSWWRHEQQSIAAALATFQHHSSRGQRKAKAGEEESETKYTAKFRTTPPPQPELFQLFEEEPGGLRPTGLVEPRGPQEPRHTVEQMADVAPMVQILDAPVPQMVDQLVDVLKLFDNSVPEQVIDVPKISQDAIPQRTVLCEPQLAEQLVEVPTVPFFVEQTVDIPVPGSGAHWGVLLEGWHPAHPVETPRGIHRQPRAVYKYWATLSGRPCDHALQVPAVLADLQWKVPQIRSSTECWTLQFLVGRLHARCCGNDRAWVRQWRKLLLRSCFPLTRWLTSLACRSCRFSGAGVEQTVVSHSCSC